MALSSDRDAATMRVIEELKRLYKTKILPLEQLYRYDLFHSPPMSDAEFDSKPQVMLIGQYSVGKTSFIRYLLGRDFPGQRIGPEPTTDRFVAVYDGPDERIIPGNALAVSHDMPFRGLERFGVSFLNRFEGAQLPSPVLRNITLVDTPGVLSGEKQRVNRGYNFSDVCTWFAQRSDLIILLFDAHKLDISDEFRTVIEGLKGNDDKIRCILNKADQVDRQRLMRVYGALMWSIGKVIKTPEVLRVYIGSFWDQPLLYDDNLALFEMEERDLMRDLKDLPRNSAVRKINELVKRVRIAKVHAYIISHLRDQMPTFMGHAKKQQELIQNLPGVFRSVMKKYNLAPGDFPEINDFQTKLQEHDFSKFHHLRQKMIDDLDAVLGSDFPRLMEALPRTFDPSSAPPPPPSGPGVSAAPSSPPPPPPPTPPVFSPAASSSSASASTGPSWMAGGEEESNPWADDDLSPASSDPNSSWIYFDTIPRFQSQFEPLQRNGLVSGAAAKPALTATGLGVSVLRKIWDLSDLDKDGSLDLLEFTLALNLAEGVKQGNPLPASLDPNLIPPTKR